MSLGRREARHQTSASAKVAGVEPSADWDFQPGQRVQTVDGLPGRVTAVQDGPVRGAEGYEVTLDDGMGGGLYTSSQLAPAPETTASLQETAAQDYPELEEVLAQRPDIARNTVLGSLKIAINDAEMSQASSERAQGDPNHACPHCGLGPHDDNGYCENCGSHIDDDEPERGDPEDDYYSQGGGHEDNYGDPYGRMDAYHDFKNSSLHETAGWSWADGEADRTGLSDGPDGFGRSVYCVECSRVHGEDLHKKDSPAKDYDGVDTSEGGDTLANGMTSGDGGSDSGSSNSTTAAEKNPINLPAEVTPEKRDEWLAGGHPGFDEHGYSKYHDTRRWRNSPSECVKSGEHMSLEGGPGYANGPGTCARCGDTAEPTVVEPYQQLLMHKALEGGKDYQDSELLMRGNDPEFPKPEAPKAKPEPIIGYPKDLVDQIPKATPEQTHFLDSNPTGPTKYSSKTASGYAWADDQRHPICEEDPEHHGYCAYHKEYHPERLEDDEECKNPWCKDEPFHTNAEHIDPPDRDPHSDAFRETEQRMNDTFGGDKNIQDGVDLLKTYQQGPTKYSALDIFDPFDILVTASTDPDFRFEVTAAWSDVRAKAKRIRTTGGVNVTMVTEGMIFGEIQGDHNVYETGLQKLPGKTSVSGWSCGCKWGAYHWGADDDFSRFKGRMCSHALALQFEAQSRGMFGRTVEPDMDKPSWVPRRVVVKYDIDADKNRTAPATRPEYGRAASLSALGALAIYAKAEGMDAEDFTVECVKAGLTAAVNSPWGEPVAEVPEVTGPTRPPHATDNPASQGFASQPDPDNWGNLISPDTIGMNASLDRDEFLFEADLDKEAWAQVVKMVAPMVIDKAMGGGDKEEAPAAPAAAAAPEPDPDAEARAETKSKALVSQGAEEDGSQAMLHDEPEAALPSTDGELDLGSGAPLSNGSPSGGAMGTGTMNIKGDPTSLEAEDQTFVSTGSVEDIVASFQQKAAHLNPGGSSVGDSDIAAAAREHLAKEAVKDFSPGEQAAIINEGEHVTAANLDRLDIAGTHYEPLEAALAARDAEEDDDAWMA